MTTRIRGSYVVGFDREKGDHVVFKEGEVVFEGDTVRYVGSASGYDGPIDHSIDARGCLVSPGLIDAHSLMDQGIRTYQFDRRSEPGMIRPRAWVTDPNQTPVFSPDEVRAGAQHTLLSMARSGVTTFCGITSMVFKRWDDAEWEPDVYAETATAVGLRAYLSHQYRAGAQYVEPDGSVGWVWDDEAALRGLERNVAFHSRWHGKSGDHIRALLFPYTCDQSSEALLRATREAADRLHVGIRMHTAQSVDEVARVAASHHGMTPVEYLDSIGFLGPDVMLTHALYGRGHDGTQGMSDAELGILADRGVTITNCPWISSTGGYLLRSIARYRAAGVNVCIGTDTQPNDMIRELRSAAITGKLADGRPDTATARTVYDAATVNAARYLGRDDIGRLEPGSKADITVVDLSGASIGTYDEADPIAALVYFGAMADVRDVFVGGVPIVRNRAHVSLDEQAVTAAARVVSSKVKMTMVGWDRLGRSANQLYPPSYEIR